MVGPRKTSCSGYIFATVGSSFGEKSPINTVSSNSTLLFTQAFFGIYIDAQRVADCFDVGYYGGATGFTTDYNDIRLFDSIQGVTDVRIRLPTQPHELCGPR